MKMTDQVSHPFKTEGKLYFFTFYVLRAHTGRQTIPDRTVAGIAGSPFTFVLQFATFSQHY